MGTVFLGRTPASRDPVPVRLEPQPGPGTRRQPSIHSLFKKMNRGAQETLECQSAGAVLCQSHCPLVLVVLSAAISEQETRAGSRESFLASM